MGHPLHRIARSLRRQRRHEDPAVGRPLAAVPAVRDGFVESLERTGDVELAAMAAIRPLMRPGRIGRLRTVSQVLQRNAGTVFAGEISRAMLALHDGDAQRAWAIFGLQDPARAIAVAPVELFRAGFRCSPAEAAALLERVRKGEVRCQLAAPEWQRIAEMSLAAGHESGSAWALQQAADLAGRRGPVAEDAAWLRRWYGRRYGVVDSDADDIAVAILDEDHPRRTARTPTQQDPGQRAVLAAVAPHRTIHLYRAGRDATSYAEVAVGTWLVVTGRLPKPLFGISTDLPYDDRYRPVFASIRVPDVAILTEPVLEQLRRCSPVGCADWDTYYLMRAARVPAFLAADAPAAVETLLAHVAAGDDESTVYDAWRGACVEAVATGLARDSAVAGSPPIEVDIAGACQAVRSKSVVIERSERDQDGPEVNIEFSLDGNLKHHMVVVLDSIVRRTTNPIRLFVLCRDHGAHDYKRLAELFPAVSFVWLPTDDVEYGSRLGKFRHITVATMDRLLLPELLPDVDRIIHHDLDTVCLADIAELASIDMGGHPIAAVTSARARYRDGLGECRGTAHRLRKRGNPDLARELIARSHLRNGLGYEVFNAGVMVLDLAQMRADSFCREFFPYAERFGMNDQAVLNAYAGSNRLVLDSSWNWCPRIEDMSAPRIAHWSGPVKPWQDRWVNGQELWREAEALAASRLRTPHASVLAK